jgi:DNA-binding NtrC family response regulator
MGVVRKADDADERPTFVSGERGATTSVTPPTGEGGDRLNLLVISDRVITTVPLPASGTVEIGRARTCDVVIDDPSISRAHASLTIGPPLVVRDLGSSNGTRVRDRVVAAGESAVVDAGDVVQLGSVTLIVQRRSLPPPSHRVWPHAYFEARIEEECARCVFSGGVFAIARFHCTPPLPASALHQALLGEGRASDVLGEYSADELEVLMVGVAGDDAVQAADRLGAALAGAGTRVQRGLARFPEDGRDPHDLIHRASPFAVEPSPDAVVSAAILADRRMQDLYRLAERIAAGNITVLVLGETGVGKEVLAERIHRMSPRADKPYLKLNCAALSESLLESELFGHERGAFTGAVAAKPGLLETADGGTVFLDEVGELPHSIQVKLLRVIEERKVTRVGALVPRAIDVRFVAATNRDLESEIARGTFRQDLFFRLNGATLVLPPLRERRAEIPELARRFVATAARQMAIDPEPRISPEALDVLSQYAWPGNIRELRNVMERAVLLCGAGGILPAHLPLDRMRPTSAAAPTPTTIPPAGDATSRVVVDAAPARADAPPDDERARILEALAACAGNQSAAAARLGIARRTLINKLERYGISGPRKRR